MTQREQRMGFWQVVGSVLAALVGVQIGTVATLILILLIWVGVKVLLAQAGHGAP